MDKERIEKIIEELNAGLYEREETIAMGLLAILSGQSVFLYGPPGTAKSMIARRLADVFHDARYFEYLMQRFSTPEDVFGPISITELKKDNYVRKTENYLPTADIAFLDEIWKSSPAILNTLLTLINERRFKNGNTVETAPLKALIAASNEFPSKNSGLDALYDRFIVRMCVEPMRLKTSFDRMITTPYISDSVLISDPISDSEWTGIMKNSSRVTIGKDVLKLIDNIRKSADKLYDKGDFSVYISDRRWQKTASLLRTSAYLSDRSSVTPIDCILIRHCVWSSDDDRSPLTELISDEIVRFIIPSVSDFEEWVTDFNKIQKRIGQPGKKNGPRLKKDVTDIIVRGKEKYIPVEGRSGMIEVPLSKIYTNARFYVPYQSFSAGRLSYAECIVESRIDNVIKMMVDGSRYEIDLSTDTEPKDEHESDDTMKEFEDLKIRLDSIMAALQESADTIASDSPFVTKNDIKLLKGSVNKVLSKCYAYPERFKEYEA